MKQALLVEAVPEPEEVWEEMLGEAGWEVLNQVLAPAVNVCVHLVELLPLIKQEYLAIK